MEKPFRDLPPIAWIGTGVMGRAMCARLMDRGARVFVFNRTKSKAAALLEAGATWCASPAEAAAQAHLVFTIVGFPDDVREVYFGANGVLAGLSRDAVCVDMTP